ARGFDPVANDLAAIASDLRNRLATGGTVDGDTVELRGDHVAAVAAARREPGYEGPGAWAAAGRLGGCPGRTRREGWSGGFAGRVWRAVLPGGRSGCVRRAALAGRFRPCAPLGQ
ncbi:MAG: hypothetical protein AB8G96_08885, partial [Phycisphaerales bacterium]